MTDNLRRVQKRFWITPNTKDLKGLLCLISNHLLTSGQLVKDFIDDIKLVINMH